MMFIGYCDNVNMAACFLRDFQRSAILKANFSMLTKCLVLTLLSKLSECYAILGKWIKYIR